MEKYYLTFWRCVKVIRNDALYQTLLYQTLRERQAQGNVQRVAYWDAGVRAIRFG